MSQSSNSPSRRSAMTTFSDDKASPATVSPTAVKAGKRQSRRREAIFDAFRSLHTTTHGNDGAEAVPKAGDDRQWQQELNDVIAKHNAAAMAGTSKPSAHQHQHSHGRSRSFFFKKQTASLASEEKQEKRKTKGESQSNKTLEQVSDMVCLAAEEGAAASLASPWEQHHRRRSSSSRRQEREAAQREQDYSSLYSQVLLPSNLSSERHRSATLGKDDVEEFRRKSSTPISPLPPKRPNARKRTQSAAVVQRPPREDCARDFTEELAFCESLQSDPFGIKSASSQRFQSLSSLPHGRSQARRGMQNRKNSTSSSNDSSTSPDSFTSASSQWAKSACSTSRSRSSSVTSSAPSDGWSFHEKSKAEGREREEHPPLPRIPARYLSTDGSKDVEAQRSKEAPDGGLSNALNTPTFGQHSCLASRTPTLSSPSMQTVVSDLTTLDDGLPPFTRGVQRTPRMQPGPGNKWRGALDHQSRAPNCQSLPASPASHGLGLSHVKLALAKDIRPLRRGNMVM